jgi:hypothetical protein
VFQIEGMSFLREPWTMDRVFIIEDMSFEHGPLTELYRQSRKPKVFQIEVMSFLREPWTMDRVFIIKDMSFEHGPWIE